MRINESSCCVTSSPAFGIVSTLDFDHSNECAVISGFSLRSLMTWFETSLHIFAFHLCIFFGEMSVQVFAHFLIWWLIFTLLSFKFSLYILNDRFVFFFRLMFFKCFIQVRCCTSHFLDIVFHKVEVFHFIYSLHRLWFCCI